MTPAAFQERGRWQSGRVQGESFLTNSPCLNTASRAHPPAHIRHSGSQYRSSSTTPNARLSASHALGPRREGEKTLEVQKHLSHQLSKRNIFEINQILTVPWVPNTDLRIGLFKSSYNFIVDAFMQKLGGKRTMQGNSQINVQFVNNIQVFSIDWRVLNSCCNTVISENKSRQKLCVYFLIM